MRFKVLILTLILIIALTIPVLASGDSGDNLLIDTSVPFDLILPSDFYDYSYYFIFASSWYDDTKFIVLSNSEFQIKDLTGYFINFDGSYKVYTVNDDGTTRELSSGLAGLFPESGYGSLNESAFEGYVSNFNVKEFYSGSVFFQQPRWTPAVSFMTAGFLTNFSATLQVILVASLGVLALLLVVHLVRRVIPLFLH